MNSAIQRDVRVIDLGLADYQTAWDYQTKLFQETLDIKKANRDLPARDQQVTSNYLIFCEHPHVFTLGKSGDPANLLLNDAQLQALGATYIHTSRGGDITYHGPGQCVVYPVIDLENFFTDIHKYMRTLEEAVILTLAEFGMPAGRINGLTGVWIDHEIPGRERKICAMGVKTSRWVTMHGLALNVNSDLSFFDKIVPCGIADKGVTSMEKELRHKVSMIDVRKSLEKNLVSLFEMNRSE